jgi:hypothetical protein
MKAEFCHRYVKGRGAMATAIEPVRFVDGLVKGTILAVYDFGRLTIAGLVLPFAFRNPRFWAIVPIDVEIGEAALLALSR